MANACGIWGLVFAMNLVTCTPCCDGKQEKLDGILLGTCWSSKEAPETKIYFIKGEPYWVAFEWYTQNYPISWYYLCSGVDAERTDHVIVEEKAAFK